jgi:hypothetical protein
MIAGILHAQSGMGDQLHRYITVRTLAEEKGMDFGMVNPENFKGASFMTLDMGKPIPDGEVFANEWATFSEKDVRDANGVDIRSYDPEINFVQSKTLIDGYFEDSKYWGHNLRNINEWLKVEPIEVPDDVCVIGFRGGEFYSDPDLGLPREYWGAAMYKMRVEKNIEKWEVHTDDSTLASQYFPGIKIIQDIGINWRSMRYAKHAIIANSAFYIMPRLLNGGLTIAPRYWARRNTKTWARPACYYKQFTYL